MATRRDEFEQIAMPHSRSLLRVARRLAGDASGAEDLVQETLLLGWRGFDQFRAGTNARAWLFRILFNVFYAQGRKLRAVPAMAPLPEAGNRGLQVSASALAAAEVNQALDSLPVEHRAVILLGIVEGFTCQEMSEILAVPIGTVMSRISRARQSLRERLSSRTPEIRGAAKAQ